MSGRAGRRGLDTFGVVVIHCRNDEVPDEATLKQVTTHHTQHAAPQHTAHSTQTQTTRNGEPTTGRGPAALSHRCLFVLFVCVALLCCFCFCLFCRCFLVVPPV